MTNAARLRSTPLYLDPAPWREFEVPLSMTLKGLHDCLQAAILWDSSHLWEFEFDGRRYGVPFDDNFGGEMTHKASDARLTKLLQTETRDLHYTYDFGDGWEHRVAVVDLFTADEDAPLPRFTGGQWRAPPDDVGGAPSFEMFLEAIANPKHPEHEHFSDWYGGPFEVEDIDEEVVKIQFNRLATARAKMR